MKNKSKTTKFISSVLIILILLPVVLLSKPKQAEAGWWSTWLTDVATGVSKVTGGKTLVTEQVTMGVALKNMAIEIGKQVLMHIASKALQEITKSTVDWINSGYWGSPLFVQNPDSFFQDIAKFEVKTIVDAFGYDPLRFPFGKAFALNTINAYKSQLNANMEYSLSRVIADPVLLKSYQTDFNVGGWNGFLINTQYPQNNYLGFQMLATEQLGQKLAGIEQNAVQKVQSALQQGMGFLSPQTCPSNPSYNTVGNQFKKPSFDEAGYRKDHPYDAEAPVCDPMDPECAQEFKNYDEEYNIQMASEKAAWAAENTCPGGLVSTTPGSVVANSIMTAMGAGQHQTELAAAMGNSISAILDSFLNKFLGSGLNALASKVNPTPAPDDWSYNGQTLGSGAYGVNNAWDAGPDEPIVLSKFKADVDNGINNTGTELALMSNADPKNPGIAEVMGQIWPKGRELDACIPGPDLGWQKRADDEMARNSGRLSEKTSDDSPEKAAQAQIALNELQYAVNFFKDWIDNKMMLELPDSTLFMDAVDEVGTLAQQSDELTGSKRTKTQTLTRLQSIKVALAPITTQPAVGSGQEKVLVALYKQYKAVGVNISSDVTIGEKQNELNVAKEKLANLNKLIKQCTTERKENGWSVPGGWNSQYSGRIATCSENAAVMITNPLPSTMTPGQDYEFTVKVINTGDSYWYHGDVFQLKIFGDLETSPSFGGLPYTVAANFSKPDHRFVEWTFGMTAPSVPGNYNINLQMVHKAKSSYLKLADDSKTPVLTEVCGNKAPVSDTYFGDLATMGVSVVGNQAKSSDPTVVPDKVDPSIAGSLPGTEKALFCDNPIKGGFTHETFIQKGAVTYPLIPLVNGSDVLNWPRFFGLFGTHHVNIQMSCNIIWRANVLDYKGNLPGLTTVAETYEAMPPDTDEGDTGSCTRPADAEKHTDPGASSAITAATDELRAGGMKWETAKSLGLTEGTPEYDKQEATYECNRFQIIKKAAKAMEAGGSDIGLYQKPTGTNCEGYSVDIMAFPDGYLYDSLGGGAEGINPTWGAASCDPVDPSRYTLAP